MGLELIILQFVGDKKGQLSLSWPLWFGGGEMYLELFS